MGKLAVRLPGVKYDGDPSLELKQRSDGVRNKAAACCQAGAISVNRSRFPKHAPRHDPSGVLSSDIFYILKACSTRMPGTGFLGPFLCCLSRTGERSSEMNSQGPEQGEERRIPVSWIPTQIRRISLFTERRAMHATLPSTHPDHRFCCFDVWRP